MPDPITMKPLLFCLISVLTAQAAFAGLPVNKYGNSCPTGTYSTRNSCVPTGDTQVYVTEGGCPVGWTKSARYYCVR